MNEAETRKELIASIRNIKYTKQWYLIYNQQDIIGQQVVGQFAKQPVSQLITEKANNLLAV
jgi:hypothetical protein